MTKLFTALILLLLLSTNLLASESKIIDTIAGKLEIKEIPSDAESWIILNNKIITKIEEYVSLKKKYDLPTKTIIILSSTAGGSDSSTSYLIIQILKSGKSSVSKTMYPMDETFSAAMSKNGTIKIDLGYDEGLKKNAIYRNGKLTIKKTKVAPAQANEDDCNYLYNNIYIRFAKEQLCNEDPYETKGLATARVVSTMQHKPRMNINPLKKMAIQACKTEQVIQYSQFRKQICHTKNKNSKAETRTSDDVSNYSLSYNDNGAVLKTKSGYKIYLGKDCDTFSDNDGKGIWIASKKGFQINFDSRKILFSKQTIDIPNTAKCSR